MLLAALEIDDIPSVVLATAALLATASLLAVVTARLRIPLTLILVALGFAAGSVARSNGVELPIEGPTFHEVLIFVFLPALVFEAALTLPARVFGQNIVPILTLAVVALAIAAALAGVIVHLGLGVSLTTALVFGALIAATDPVAVTATFRELGVPSRLLVLVEGESLLNDGIAIVLFEIFLAAALGTEAIGVTGGAADFLYVAVGGAALGGALGLGVAELAARLGRMPSTALTIALAYGSFVLADEILGFSGVMATVSAGLVLSALSNTLIPTREVETWHSVWGSLGFVANGLLFLLIGIVIDAELIVDNLDWIAVGIGAVIVSRPVAIFPIMPLVTRLAGIPRIGFRNELVLVWGGLRGGVALALALSIPDALPEQERFIAMTAGVVLATLLLSATTIRPLVHRLGLDRPDRVGRFVASAAQYEGARAARAELRETLGSSAVDVQLSEAEGAAAEELRRVDLRGEELYQALLRRGLFVERASMQELVDEGLLPQWHARVALNALEDMLDELALGRTPRRGLFEARGIGRLVYAIARRIHLGRITPDKWADVAYRDLHARIRAAHDAVGALEVLTPCPGVHSESLERARGHFERWQRKAREGLRTLTSSVPFEVLSGVERRYAADLGRVVSEHQLSQLEEVGLVSPAAVRQASETIAKHLERAARERIEVPIEPEEDIGV